MCSNTCGNGMLDRCSMAFYIDETLCWRIVDEPCDGTLNTSRCESLGYYGGTPSCSVECQFDDRGCDACAPSVACTAFAISGPATSLVASDPSTPGPLTLALTTSHSGPGASSVITRFDQGASGFVQVGQVPSSRPVKIAVTGGWFAADFFDSGIDVLDSSGNFVVSKPLFTSPGNVAMSYGPGAHALVTSSSYNAATLATVFDASGATVAPPFVIFPPADAVTVSKIATDGTSFFAAGRGQLARIGADGSGLSVTSGFPVGRDRSWPEVSWDGTSGWYVVSDSVAAPRVHTAQRFDATGAKVGASVTITPGILLSDHIEAYGTGLLAISMDGATSEQKVELVRLDATGAVMATYELGVGQDRLDFDPTFVRCGSQIAVTWFGAQQRQLTLVTP